ncbi:MAG: OmpA family protein [Candidatus Zixiibacteriota bacterium]
MHRIKHTLLLLAIAFGLVGLPLSAQAQLGGLKKAAKKKVEEKAKEKVEQTGEGTSDQEHEEKTDAAEQPGEEGAAEGTAGEAALEKPGGGVWLKYDFVPGDRVIFFEDFTRDEVGNFPQRLELLKGNMEVAEWKGIRWLRGSTYCDFVIPLPEVLPSRFTFEFDLYAPWEWNTVDISTVSEDEDTGDAELTEVCFAPWERGGGVKVWRSKEALAMGKVPDTVLNEIMHCRVMADGKYMKVYINETRVANFPNTNFGRSDRLYFYVSAEEERPAMFANFRIAASDKKMYDALTANGRVATQGIFFDSGSDKIRPESTPTLKEIGLMLKDHPDLKLLIEGHTDNVGDDAANQTLSEKRANAVRDNLISQYGIEGTRLQAKGYGETKPVSSNDTPEGRQNNRRVELVKL